jgi:hypothetical protein
MHSHLRRDSSPAFPVRSNLCPKVFCGTRVPAALVAGAAWRLRRVLLSCNTMYWVAPLQQVVLGRTVATRCTGPHRCDRLYWVAPLQCCAGGRAVAHDAAASRTGRRGARHAGVHSPPAR